MTTWTYERGHLVAHNSAGMLLVKLQADRAFSPLADLLNACPDLSRLLLAGHGQGEQKKGAVAPGSHQAQLGHGSDLLRRDDEVIEETNVHHGQCSLERRRQVLVGA